MLVGLPFKHAAPRRGGGYSHVTILLPLHGRFTDNLNVQSHCVSSINNARSIHAHYWSCTRNHRALLRNSLLTSGRLSRQSSCDCVNTFQRKRRLLSEQCLSATAFAIATLLTDSYKRRYSIQVIIHGLACTLRSDAIYVSHRE